MNKNIYLIKKLAPWMIDELIAFSEITSFEIIFLRKQDGFYDDTINQLKENDIKIYTKPYALNNFFKKIIFIVKFVFSNLFKFTFDYNGVLGLKSVVWFLRLDLSMFSPETKIHTQFATQGALVSLLIKRYFKDMPQYSFTFHAYDIYFKNGWFNLLVDESYRSFSISDYNINYINENYQPSENIKLSRLGVFRDQLKSDRSVINEDGVLRLGLISWFIEKKGIIYLLEALVELKKNGVSNIEFILAGDGPLKKEYLNFIEKNDLGDTVNYVGTLKGQEKIDFFKKIDIFILPSIELKNDKDGIPVVLMEAIAASLPIISTDVSGIPEICYNDYNGILIEERNVTEIVKAINFMIENKAKRMLYGENSLKLSEQYDIVLNSKKKVKELEWS